MTEQHGFSGAGFEQSGEHLHGGGFAAAIAAEKPEDFATAHLQRDIIDRDKLSELLAQALGVDHDGVILLLQGWNDQILVPTQPLGRQQHEEGLLQVLAASTLQQFLRGASGQHLAFVHGDQPVVLLRFFHVGGGHDHAHFRPLCADPVNQLPELAA